MAFRQVARATEQFHISWSPRLAVLPVVEADALEIGALLLRTGHPLRPECEVGTLRGATFYVTRLFDYHRADRNYPLSLEASSIVRNASTNQVVGVCLVGGGGDDGTQFGLYDILVDPSYRGRAIGANMIRRALSVLAEHGVGAFHLWREDDARARRLYERLGFEPTGAEVRG